MNALVRRVAIGAGVVLLAVAGAVVLRGCGFGPFAPTASFPATAAGRPAMTVTEAIGRRDAGDASDLVVAGWFQQPFPYGCPMLLQAEVPVIEGCSSFAGWLLARPEAVVHHADNTMWTSPAAGPSVDVVLDGPGRSWERPLPADGDAVPTPVVLVGHFHDPRATGCQPENRQECQDEFVVTHVAWADGTDNP